jgi:hypothetical protein
MQSDLSLADDRFNGGWPHRTLNYYSWALSCLQLRQFYDVVELVTDEIGKEILIQKMKLPYTKVTTRLDELDDYHHGLWNMGKLFTYGLQREPFLHVDSDVFIFQEFGRNIVNASLVAQNLEKKVQVYSSTFKNVIETFSVIPDHLRILYDMEFTPSCNAGILGGNCISFYQTYVQEVFSFIKNNRRDVERLVAVNAGSFSVVIEQVFFYSLAKRLEIEITYLLPEADGFPPQIGYFHEAANNSNFVHCVSSYKKDVASYLLLELRLKENYPDWYKRIKELVADAEI